MSKTRLYRGGLSSPHGARQFKFIGVNFYNRGFFEALDKLKYKKTSLVYRHQSIKPRVYNAMK
jgi:hypothetical protein